jgi:arylsulfatase A-like enzyme/Tfp pilus assembly protein PilF
MQIQAAPRPAKGPPPNVVLITLDTVRADHVGCYGAESVETPVIDALARDGVVFDHAISQVPLTWPSHAVILTGLYPFQNGAQDFTGSPLDSRFRTVAQVFKQSGYATGAVISSFALDRSWGLARGFDFYDDVFSPEQLKNRDLGLVERKAEDGVTHAIGWLQKNPRRPFFLWLHLYDPHSSYNPPEPYHTRFQGRLYDGEIAYADHELGRLMAWLKQKRLYEGSLIVLLSDHGESLGEHGEREHGFFVYDATVRIPLIVKPPAGSGIWPSRIQEPVETTAVAPTLLGTVGRADPIRKQFQAGDLLSAGNSGATAYSETFYPFNSFGWSPLHALQTSQYHYIDAPEPELYDLAADPGEQKNVAESQPATAAVLRDKLHALLKKNPFAAVRGAGPNLSADSLAKLRALGYAAYHAPVSDEQLATRLADPKNKLWEFNSIISAEEALHLGDFDRGRSLLAEVREKDRQMYIVPFILGEAALAERKWEEASTEFNRCVELNPNFDQAMTGLARALIYQGKLAEAKPWVQKALQFNPQNYRAWYELGIIDAPTDKPAAISHYQKAVSIQSNFGPLRRDLGLLQFQQRDYAGAAQNLAKAVDLGIREHIVFNSLGISYSRTNQLRKSVESYKQALELNPQFAETHVNLAIAYQRLNQTAEAQQEFQAACKLETKFCQLVPETRP